MTGNVTDFATSKRLAKVWPFAKSPIECRFWAVSPEEKEYLRNGCAGQRRDGVWHDVTDGCLVYPARDLSELEAKIREMKLRGNIYISAIDISCVLLAEEDVIRGGEANTIINALGAAVAKALEAAAEGEK